MDTSARLCAERLSLEAGYETNSTSPRTASNNAYQYFFSQVTYFSSSLVLDDL